MAADFCWDRIENPKEAMVPEPTTESRIVSPSTEC